MKIFFIVLPSLFFALVFNISPALAAPSVPASYFDSEWLDSAPEVTILGGTKLQIKFSKPIQSFNVYRVLTKAGAVVGYKHFYYFDYKPEQGLTQTVTLPTINFLPGENTWFVVSGGQTTNYIYKPSTKFSQPFLLGTQPETQKNKNWAYAKTDFSYEIHQDGQVYPGRFWLAAGQFAHSDSFNAFDFVNAVENGGDQNWRPQGNHIVAVGRGWDNSFVLYPTWRDGKVTAYIKELGTTKPTSLPLISAGGYSTQGNHFVLQKGKWYAIYDNLNQVYIAMHIDNVSYYKAEPPSLTNFATPSKILSPDSFLVYTANIYNYFQLRRFEVALECLGCEDFDTWTKLPTKKILPKELYLQPLGAFDNTGEFYFKVKMADLFPANVLRELKNKLPNVNAIDYYGFRVKARAVLKGNKFSPWSSPSYFDYNFAQSDSVYCEEECYYVEPLSN